MARIAESESRFADPNDVMSQAKEYIYVKNQLDYLTEKSKVLRNQLFDHLDQEGEYDSKGNILIELDSEIDGVTAIKKERRVSRKVDEIAAEMIIAEKNLEDKLYKTIRVIDEDALMAALYSDDLTEEEIDRMYPEIVTWALKTLKK